MVVGMDDEEAEEEGDGDGGGGDDGDGGGGQVLHVTGDAEGKDVVFAEWDLHVSCCRSSDFGQTGLL